MSQGERTSRFSGPLRALRSRDASPSAASPSAAQPGYATGQDERWVAAIVQDHGNALLAYATRLTGDRHAAEDVVQETLIRAWRNRADLHEARGSVRGWLLTVTRNIVIDRSRARAARPLESPESPTTPPMVGDHADNLVTTLTLLEALDQLSEEHRAVLTELYFNDRSVSEVAQMLGIAAGTVKSRTYYALRQLRGNIKPIDLQ